METNSIVAKLNEIAIDLENKNEYWNAEKLVAIANVIDRMESNLQLLYNIAWDLQSIDRSKAMELYHLINEIAPDVK